MTIARFHSYSLALEALVREGRMTVSSDELGRLSGASAALVRSDLFTLGFSGIRGVGYEAEALLLGVNRTLGRERVREVIIVGAGKLGRALAGYLSESGLGLRVRDLVDSDPAKIGDEIAGERVKGPGAISSADLSDVLAIIATPPSSAQIVTDELVLAGARSILNFAPVALEVPHGVTVRRVDVAAELYVLSYFHKRG